ncbi:MAG: ester cyclase [Thermomicrobiales bacterium]
MTVERTRATMTAYLEALVGNGAYGALLAPDATLTMMESGEVTRGRDAVADLIACMHARAFAATMEIISLVVDERRAMIEAVFIGKHTGEFAGIAPTGREVRLPYAVAYDLDGDASAITALRMYLSLDALVQQIRGT